MKRRRFMRLTAGAFGLTLGQAALCIPASSDAVARRRILVCSDLHIGHSADDSGNKDGEEWFVDGLADLDASAGRIDYATVLGDIAHTGEASEYNSYLQAREQSGITEWYEIAGNHDYWGENTIDEYRELINSHLTFGFIDGNMLWLMLSDEEHSTGGEIGDATHGWVKSMIAEHKPDKNIIICSHQLVYETVRKSTDHNRYMEPLDNISDILETGAVDLWLSGHQHSMPWTREDRHYDGTTTFLNVASMTHAYDTLESQSFVLEFEQGAPIASARRRVHDKESYAQTLAVPLRVPVDLDGTSRREIIIPS
ncbi:MAG: hypothetical protein GF418_11955 [Chitinivibrionales bacterium]|nr:hypothetical protein [Chitinivibrionales bacterium]MBD3396331.1 hypothetical protein [Chitinivibrionales bacterium]